MLSKSEEEHVEKYNNEGYVSWKSEVYRLKLLALRYPSCLHVVSEDTWSHPKEHTNPHWSAMLTNNCPLVPSVSRIAGISITNFNYELQSMADPRRW